VSPTSRTGAEAERVFSPEVIAQVRRLELRTRGLVESLFSGEYHSVFKGRGLEFSDVREYQPGDDVRAIDWSVTARRGRPFVKEYVEERQLNALLMVDVSASKDFGTGARRNRETAAEIAATLALCAAGNNDRVGLLLVTDRVELYVAPDTGRRHALRLVLELLAFRPVGRATKLSVGMAFAEKVMRQRTSVFLISDFLTNDRADPSFEHAARKLGGDHDLVAIRLTDPGASTVPNVGLLALSDPESGERRLVDTSRTGVRAAFQSDVAAHREEMTATLRNLRVDVVEVDTTADYVPALLDFFKQRGMVRR
jgi:uncharacterized protein (DUF58 family)